MPGPVDLQPVLTGKLLELRPLRRSDQEELFRTASDPMIWDQHPVRDRWKRPAFDAYFEDRIASGGALIAIERASGAFAGASAFHRLNLEESDVEIGATFLARRFWGGAFNGEMKQLMIDHALRFVDRVSFAVSEGNLRSQAAMEKIGARRERLFMRNGIPYLLFRISKFDWAAATTGNVPRRGGR